jgi:hypothetical protein
VSHDPALDPQPNDLLVLDGETWVVTGRRGEMVDTIHPDGNPHPVSLDLWRYVSNVPGVAVSRPTSPAPKCSATFPPDLECNAPHGHRSSRHCWKRRKA